MIKSAVIGDIGDRHWPSQGMLGQSHRYMAHHSELNNVGVTLRVAACVTMPGIMTSWETWLDCIHRLSKSAGFGNVVWSAVWMIYCLLDYRNLTKLFMFALPSIYHELSHG